MTCNEARKLLAELLEDALPQRQRSAVEEHLASCPTCQAEHAALTEVDSLLEAVERPEPPTGLWAHIEARLETRPARLVWRARLVWAGAAAAVVVIGLALRPGPDDPHTPYLKDHYRVASTTALGSPAVGDVLAALAEEQ